VAVGVKVGVAVGVVANGHNDVMGVRSKVCDAGGWQRTELFRVSTMRPGSEPLANHLPLIGGGGVCCPELNGYARARKISTTHSTKKVSSCHRFPTTTSQVRPFLFHPPLPRVVVLFSFPHGPAPPRGRVMVEVPFLPGVVFFSRRRFPHSCK
jgi:hypothetical protein